MIQPADLVQQQKRIPFAGLTDDDDGSIPAHVATAVDGVVQDPEYTFQDIIDILPDASEGDLLSVNEFVDPDGFVDTDAVADALEDAGTVDAAVEDIEQPDEHCPRRLVPVTDYIEIVDERRQALHALGYETEYRWQIATDNYTIINPQEAYEPALATFKKNHEGDAVFGWADLDEYGGAVDIYLLFRSKTVYAFGGRDGAEEGADTLPMTATEDTDSTEESADGDASDEPDPIYTGVQTGYDFTSSRAFDSQMFGFDSEREIWLFNLGPRRSRKHIGKATSIMHERKNDRFPISEWWANEYDNIEFYTDQLVETIVEAHEQTLDFTEVPYSVPDFYELLSIPSTYAEEAATLATKGESLSSMSAWTLGISLLTTIEACFEATEDTDDHMSATFRAHAEKAVRLIRFPERECKKVTREYYRENFEDNDGAGTDFQLTATEIEALGGNPEGQSPIRAKRELFQDKQEKLFSFTG